MANKAELAIHRLINKERRQRGIPIVRWSGHLYQLARKHSARMAKSGQLFHTRYTGNVGENCCGGKGNMSPSKVVSGWMNSHGHRAWLLNNRLKTAAVGMSISRHGTYVAWTFSEQRLDGHKGIVQRTLARLGRLL